MSVTHLLDTSWIIRHLWGAAAYSQTIRNIGAPQLAISIVSLAELYEGAFRSSRRADAEQALTLALTGITLLPINDATCRLFGEHRARLDPKARRRPAVRALNLAAGPPGAAPRLPREAAPRSASV